MPADIPEMRRAAWLVSGPELASTLRTLADQLDPLPTTREQVAELVMVLLSLRPWLEDAQRYAVAEHARLGRQP